MNQLQIGGPMPISGLHKGIIAAAVMLSLIFVLFIILNIKTIRTIKKSNDDTKDARNALEKASSNLKNNIVALIVVIISLFIASPLYYVVTGNPF